MPIPSSIAGALTISLREEYQSSSATSRDCFRSRRMALRWSIAAPTWWTT